MNYKYLTKENIIRLHKKIVETTGGEKGMEFTLSIAKNELNLDGVIEWIRRHAKGEG